MGTESPPVCETVPEPTESTVCRGRHTAANHFQSTVKTDAADLKQLAYVTLATLDGHTQMTAQIKKIFLVLGKTNKFADYPENEQSHRINSKNRLIIDCRRRMRIHDCSLKCAKIGAHNTAKLSPRHQY